MRSSRTIKVLAVALPLVVTTALWLLSKLMDETAMAGLSATGGVAQLAGLYSVILMCIGLIITARSSIVEGIYGGLGKLYPLHPRLGEIALKLGPLHLVHLIPRTRKTVT